MPAAFQTITIEQGATWYDTLILNQPGYPLVPINLTGYTARMSIRESYESPESLIDLTLENARLRIPTPADGSIVRRIDAADTSLLNFTSGVYDLEIESPDGTVIRLLQGRVNLKLGVTK